MTTLTRLEAATQDYLRFRELKQQMRWISDIALGRKFETSERSIRKIRAGVPVSTISDEDRDLILQLIAERNAMRKEAQGKDLQAACRNHHVGKTTLINHLIAIGQWEDGV